ncbi:Rho GTPase activation protein [Cytidiella melzeri]|nr:Rho GTPase activation protein [Cytidiella melzeri]
MLKIYLEETTLYQTISINQLHHTDIRPIHRSLFDRKDCLGIFCNPEATYSFTPTSDPLYLAFSDSNVMNIWIALLRSYASPEVYGRWIYPSEGGLYRMWRQIEMFCVQGRNLGTSRLPEELGETESKQEDLVDIDVYCEIFVNGYLSGRTTTKKGLGSPDWQEKFEFLDLPPFGTLEIIVWRDKKLTKPVMIGSTVMALMNFRRRDFVEGWFPVVSPQHHAGIVVGEIRLKMRVDEEIILPRKLYNGVLQAMQAMNCLDWITELDSRYKIRQIVQEHFLAIARSQNTVEKDIMDLADREVDGTPQSHTTLFRGSTNLTRTLEAYMSIHGGVFLEASLGGVLRRICSDRVAIETDPIRSRKTGRNIEKNVELLAHWCQEFWRSIYDARKQCPEEMREIFVHIRSLIESRYQVHTSHHADLPWQGVSAFLFLRFFIPTILHPHLYGFWPGMTDEPVQRTLTQIAKVLLSLANLNVVVHDQDSRAVKDFLINSCPKMIKYLDSVSLKSSDSGDGLRSLPSSHRHDRKRLMNVVKHRVHSAPTLNREAIPVLPQMIDLPKHLAVVTSIVVRYTRRTLPARTGAPGERVFDEFCQKCLEVEEQALIRVSQLASHGKTRRKLSVTANLTFLRSPIDSPTSPTSPNQREHNHSPQGEERDTSIPLDSRMTRRKSYRPSSAPGDVSPRPPDSPSSNSQISSPVVHPTMSRAHSQELPRHPEASLLAIERSVIREGSQPRPIRPSLRYHPRSNSADSAFIRNDPPLPSSSSAPLTYNKADLLLADSEEDAGRRKKGLLRGFLRK